MRILMGCRWFLLMTWLCLPGSNTCFGLFRELNEPKTIDEARANIARLVNSAAKSLFPSMIRVATESNISMSCSLSLLHFYKDLTNLKLWALKMIDATAKPSAGFLRGSIAAYGDYDECLDVTVTNARGKILFGGKYCMLELRAPEFITRQFIALQPSKGVSDLIWAIREYLSFRLGVCVPSTCAPGEISRMVRLVSRPFGFQNNVTCETKVIEQPNWLQLACLCVFSLLAFVVIIGTGIDLITQHTRMKMNSGELSKLMIAFSIYSNSIRLFRTVQNDSTLTAVRGCRVLSAFWVIFGHIYFIPEPTHFLKYRGTLNLGEFAGQLTFRAVLGATITIDTFFMLSGMLFLYTAWRKLERSEGRMNPLTNVLLPMARILPFEVLTIALFMVLPVFGNGPIWKETFRRTYTDCWDTWWTDLLFVQNFWPIEHTCLFHLWFISALFQLRILMFGIILVIYRWPKVGVCINLLLIVTGCAVIGILTSSYNLPSYFAIDGRNIDLFRKYYIVVYSKPYTYLCSCCVGILLGYAVVTKRHLHIKPSVQLTGWMLSTCGVGIVLYGPHFFDNKKELDIPFAALHRTIWSSSVAWMLFACIAGYGGIIGRLLSWKGMVPLDRLTLLIYLLHPLVIYYYTARIRAAIHVSNVEQVYVYLATVIVALGLSYVFNVTFQQPLRYIEKRIASMIWKKSLSDVLRGKPSLPPTGKQESLPETTFTLADLSKEESSSSSKL